MLKIKNNVDLKKLEKYGFKHEKMMYGRERYYERETCIDVTVKNTTEASSLKLRQVIVNAYDIEVEAIELLYNLIKDGLLTLETLYTSQDKDTELSFINNVIAIQEVIKAIRSRCPIIRYSYMDNTENLENYKRDVQDVLDGYSINFAKLEMVYLEDKTMIDNKVFYAAIQCSFKNFIQKEYFKIYPIEL